MPARLYRASSSQLQPIITTTPKLSELTARLDAQPRVGLDTEFLRERTYRAQLCLVQVSAVDLAACVDPLALPDLGALAAVLTSPAVVKVMHASRQDLEVLLPVAGLVRPVFDTQIAASLTGLPAQIGYAELVRRLLGHELPKAHTRTDWSRRPLSAEQLDYALDDVHYLLPLAEQLQEQVRALGRSQWLEEELRSLEDPAALTINPEDAWQRLKGLNNLDPARARLARHLAAWRERSAIEHNRPRGWILEEPVLREMITQVPRSLAQLEAIPGMPPGLAKRRGTELLACVAAAEVPEPTPALPPRARPDPVKTALVKRLAEIIQSVATELNVVPEVLATRRDLEQLAAGKQDAGVLSGWRRSVLGERLLAAL